MKIKYIKLFLFSLAVVLAFSSCSKMGYGILLWSIEDPPIFSGSIMPVYIKSNIDKVWVVGIPDHLKAAHGSDKIEVPISRFEFVGSKRKAETRAVQFAEYSIVYAENLTDGLPIRDNTDNNARRVYRLRVGEIIKVLGKAQGNPPIGASGDPLPGDWLKVLTSDGVTGFCFSNRLKLYHQDESTIQTTATVQRDNTGDQDLELVFTKIWSPESYLQMLNSRRINILAMEQNYRFEPGQETGIAKIILPDLEREFAFEKITSDGDRSWRFEGTPLQMALRSNTSLTVQFTEGVSRRTLQFAVLPSEVSDIIVQETARREEQFKTIYNQGPVFTSNNYGTITFMSTGNFTWSGFELLVPQLFPADTKGTGRITMDLFIAPAFEDRYNGAFTLQFTDVRTNNIFYFMYGLDNQGLRLEVVPGFGIEDIIVTRRAQSPMILYFFKDSP